MESNPRDYGEQCRFDAFCKKVLRNEARAYLRNMKRQREREAFFSDLSQAELDKLCVMVVTPATALCSRRTATIYISTTSLWPRLSLLCRRWSRAF